MKKRAKSTERSCPVRSTPECLDFPPVERTPESAGMTAEQIATARISPHARLWWCSECTSIWHETEHHFAHIIGKQQTWGSPFIPGAQPPRQIWLG